MKAIKKLLVILMSICLIFGSFSITASAAEPTGSITIQNPSHSDATVALKTFNVYKVFNASTSATSTSYSWYTDGNGNIPFYDYFFGADGVLGEKQNGNVQEAVDHIAQVQDEKGNIGLSQLAEEFHEYIEKKNQSSTVIETVIPPVVVDEGKNSVTIPNLSYGYYLVYDATDLTGNTSAVRSAVMLTTVNKDAVVTLKANRPEITKSVLENDGNTYGNGTSATIGDTVSFKITTLVPSHTLYTTYHYSVEDTMHDGLELKADSIKVKWKGATVNEGEHYDLDVPTSGSVDFKVDFTNYMHLFEIGDELTIEYDAVVTTGIKAQKANANTATLIYSNDPTDDLSTGRVSDDANVYSYQFVFTKFAQDANKVFMNVRLIGAEFQLYQKGDDGEYHLVKFTEAPASVEEDEKTLNFTKYVVDPAGTVETLKVHEEGAETINLSTNNYGGHRGDITIFGLAEGEYKLVETKAPDGYVLPDKPFYVTITDEIGVLGSVGTLQVNGTHDGSGSIVNLSGKAESILTVWAEITNQPGSALPETGGIGTTIFFVIGAVLMIGALAFFTSRKRGSAA